MTMLLILGPRELLGIFINQLLQADKSNLPTFSKVYNKKEKFVLKKRRLYFTIEISLHEVQQS